MSGIELKKNDNHSKKQKIKMGLCLLCSNLFLFLLISAFGGKTDSPEKIAQGPRPLHEGYERLKLPLRLHLVYSESDKEIPVTIYSEDRKRLIEKAYLHPEKPEDENFIVEIPNTQLRNLIDHQGKIFEVYPLEKLVPLSKNKQGQGVSYEVYF